MSYKNFNPNPQAQRVGDCVIRAVSIANGMSWEDAYLDLCIYGLIMCDLPSANSVWGRYLHDKGFTKKMIPYNPDCCTVKRFADSHRHGTYVLALSGHVVAVNDGMYIDTWDSGNEPVLYYWERSKQ